MATKRSIVAASEAQEQAAYIDWAKTQQIRINGKTLPLVRFVSASLNGAYLGGDKKRRAIQIEALKRAGMRVGASDLMVAVPMAGAHGLWLEMKRTKKNGGRKPSEEQCLFAYDMREAGYVTAVGFGAERAIFTTIRYLSSKTLPEDALFPMPKSLS